MNLTFIKEGTVEDFFKAISSGMIAQDTGGYYYRLDSGKLMESHNLECWFETNEFEYGTINGVWKIYRETRVPKKKVQNEEKKEKEHTTSIREHVLKLANSTIVKGFYSSGVAKKLKMPLEEVEKQLEETVKKGLVQKKHQLLCHNDHCLKVLDTKKDRSEFKQEYECDVCGEEIEEINEQYIQNIFGGIN